MCNWTACSPDLSATEKKWHIMKWNILQRKPWSVEQLKTYIKMDKCNWSPQFPNTVLLKENMMQHSGKHAIINMYFIPLYLGFESANHCLLRSVPPFMKMGLSMYIKYKLTTCVLHICLSYSLLCMYSSSECEVFLK